MTFEEYQFLRYFIPGSLYVIYTTALIVPILNPTVIDFFKKDTSALLGVVGGAFGASLAVGYIIYTFYDTFGYTPRMMDRNKRKMLDYIDHHVEGWKEPIEANKKEFLDMLWIKFGENGSGDKYYATVKSMWSHLNARIVCYLYVPIFSAISVPIIAVYSIFVVRKTLFFLDLLNILVLVIVSALIFLVSVILKYGSYRPMDEGTTLEYFFYMSLIESKKRAFTDFVESLDLKVTANDNESKNQNS